MRKRTKSKLLSNEQRLELEVRARAFAEAVIEVHGLTITCIGSLRVLNEMGNIRGYPGIVDVAICRASERMMTSVDRLVLRFDFQKEELQVTLYPGFERYQKGHREESFVIHPELVEQKIIDYFDSSYGMNSKRMFK